VSSPPAAVVRRPTPPPPPGSAFSTLDPTQTAPRPRRLPWGLALAGLAALAILAGGIGRSRVEFRSFTGQAMATDWRVTLPARAGAGEAAEEVLALYQRLDLELSEWKEGSPLAAVNRAAGRAPVAVPEELFDLVARSVELGRATGGAFDVSWAALWGLWSFRGESHRLPDAAAVAARAALVDSRRIELDPGRRTIFLPREGMQLGLGAIGKGYALERAAARLEELGFHDFLLVGGGQVLARGERAGRPWRIGVRDPRGAPDDLFARLEVADASLATSADNEAFFELDGVRYHHVLDPATGWPARGARSATVLHRDATLADALSTALLVMGPERGFEVVRALGGEALVVDSGGALRVTPGLQGRVELLHPPRGG